MKKKHKNQKKENIKIMKKKHKNYEKKNIKIMKKKHKNHDHQKIMKNEIIYRNLIALIIRRASSVER